MSPVAALSVGLMIWSVLGLLLIEAVFPRRR